MSAEKMKVCSRCEEEFPATAEFFRRNVATKDGLLARCKKCSKECDKERRHQQKIKRGWTPPKVEPSLPGEEWRPVVGYEEFYEVSCFGRVKRIKAGGSTFIGKILKPLVRRDRYLLINICKNGEQSLLYCHHLVMDAFIGPRPEGMEANHKDGNKANNCVDNLEYVTRGENIKHAHRLGLYHKILTQDDIPQIRKLLAEGELFLREIGDIYGVDLSTIHDIKFGRSWSWVK